MNSPLDSPLDHDFDGFKFSAQSKIRKDGATELLQNFGMSLSLFLWLYNNI